MERNKKLNKRISLILLIAISVVGGFTSKQVAQSKQKAINNAYIVTAERIYSQNPDALNK